MVSNESGGKGPSTSELRRYRRYPAQLAVDISLSSWNEVVPMTTDNISRGGLFVRCESKVEIGTPVEITFELPDETALKVSGKIVHAIEADRSKPGKLAAGFGVRFDEKHETDLVLLEAIAASNSGGGKDTYELDETFLSLPAMLRGLDKGISEATSAHRLLGVKKPAAQAVKRGEKKAPAGAAATGSDGGLAKVPSFELTASIEADLKAFIGHESAPAIDVSGDDEARFDSTTAETKDHRILGLGASGPGAPRELTLDTDGEAAIESDRPAAAPPPPPLPDDEGQPLEVDVDMSGDTDAGLRAVAVEDARLEPALRRDSVEVELDEGELEDLPESMDREEALGRIAETKQAADGEQMGTFHPPSVPRKTPLMDPKAAIFGIDFGTSYTSIALITDERLTVLHDEEGQTLLPSVVCYPDKGAPRVGWPAREAMLKNPTTTFTSPKRLLGRRYDEPSIQPYLGSSAVRTKAGPGGEVIAEIFGEPIAIPQVCSEIFRRIAQIGEHASGIPVKRVVIAAPVGYISERKALRRAAQMAGLEVLGLLSEPNAAAIAYGLGRRNETALVYDFGGGTFDCTVIRIKDNEFEVLGTEGDAWLGGDDFDLALATYAAEQFEKQRKVDLRKRQVEWQHLMFLAERAKRKLSFEQQVKLLAKGILLSIKGPIDLDVDLDRSLFQRVCGELVERSLAVVDGCLTLTGTHREDIDQIVMTGGVSRIPLVRQSVQAFFDRDVRLTVDPEQAVVVGCSIFGRYLSLAQ
jgi:actin-like ATPase involved in cell morphogenesis/Tfp pilus assembly protein PilZ